VTPVARECAARIYRKTGNRAVLSLLPPSAERVLDVCGGAGDDMLLLSHVLEHMVRRKYALAHRARLVRADGMAFAAVPNIASWRMRHLRGDWTRSNVGFMDETHLVLLQAERIASP
jgi:hypothetical protein